MVSESKGAEGAEHRADGRPAWVTLHLRQIQWVRDLLVLGSLLALLRLGHQLSLVTVPVLLAVLLAYLLEPVVALVERRTPLARTGSTSVVLGGGLVLALVPLLVGGSFAALQVARLAMPVSEGSAAVVASVRAPDDVVLQEQVPELFAELFGVAVRDGVDHLVGFLEEVGGEGVEGLFAVPRASPRIAQTVHDLDETIKAF